MNVIGHYDESGQFETQTLSSVVKRGDEHPIYLLALKKPTPLEAGEGQVVIVVFYVVMLNHFL
jgi:hypothetical protein